MRKAFKEIGLRKSMRFLAYEIALLFLKILLLPQARAAYLRFLGATIGKDTVILEAKFYNCYRKGFKGLRIGDNCFIGPECLFDLAESITLGNNVTLASRATIITHINVGYRDHPLQQSFPSSAKGVVIKDGVFIGAGATILAGVTVQEGVFVAAAALVQRDVEKNTLVAGVPAETIRVL